MGYSHDQFQQIIGEVVDLQHAAALLEWDEQVYMPTGGAPRHGEMLATIKKIAHEKFIADEIGAAITDLRSRDGGSREDSSWVLDVTLRDYEKARRVPAEFVAKQARIVSAAQHAWIHARAASNFAAFAPHLQDIVALKQEYVSFFPPADHPYDILLDDFEPGMKTAEMQTLLGELRPRQVALIRELAGRPAPDASFLQVPYDEATLTAFAVDVITTFGFDWTRGRQDKAVHPFASAIGPDDVRITTRFIAHEPFSVFFGTVHETGHALYEQGIPRALCRTIAGNAASLGVHESQSRLWENLVARSRPFWEHFYPALQSRCGEQLGAVTVDRFYRGINKVTPSFIRVEADEATYNLHVMLRVELELALLTGSLAVRDLPEAWRARMQEYLGVTPPDDARGALQDIHWSIGAFGYFGTYTLGNVISAQLWDAFERTHPSRDEDMRRGEFSPLLSWLRDQVHQHARKFTAQELVRRVTGGPIQAGPYLDYLERKYRDVYNA